MKSFGSNRENPSGTTQAGVAPGPLNSLHTFANQKNMPTDEQKQIIEDRMSAFNKCHEALKLLSEADKARVISALEIIFGV